MMPIFFLAHPVYSENRTRCTAISSDTLSIYKLDPSTWTWSVDKRWKNPKYSFPCISPSGRYLAFEKFLERGFYVVEPNGKIVVDYVLPIDKHISDISWHPREKFLAFLGPEHKHDVDTRVGNIHLYNIKSNEFRTISYSATCFNYPSPPSWNDTGDKLYFINKDHMIVEYNIVNDTSQVITHGKGVH